MSSTIFKTSLLSLLLITGLISVSCSSDQNSDTNTQDEIQDTEVTDKKLIYVAQESTHGLSEKFYSYDQNNLVTEMTTRFTEYGETPNADRTTIFVYEDQLIVSAVESINGVIFRTYTYMYTDGLLTEKIMYDDNGMEDERYEYFYGNDHLVESFQYYVYNEPQESQSFVYDTEDNIITIDGYDYSEILYDNFPSPSNLFSLSQRIILEPEQGVARNISSHNQVERTTYYNYTLPNEDYRYFETSISYDSDNYPITKTVTQTDSSGNMINTFTSYFTYE